MIFQHTIDNVLNGTKTMTRRLIKGGQKLVMVESAFGGHRPIYVQTPAGRVLYRISSTYAAQPSRTKKGVARIQITNIKHEDVRYISKQEAKCEGFGSIDAFLMIWCEMHDPQALRLLDRYTSSTIYRIVMDRPKERYQAWALTFTLAAGGTP